MMIDDDPSGTSTDSRLKKDKDWVRTQMVLLRRLERIRAAVAALKDSNKTLDHGPDILLDVAGVEVRGGDQEKLHLWVTGASFEESLEEILAAYWESGGETFLIDHEADLRSLREPPMGFVRAAFRAAMMDMGIPAWFLDKAPTESLAGELADRLHRVLLRRKLAIVAPGARDAGETARRMLQAAVYWASLGDGISSIAQILHAMGCRFLVPESPSTPAADE